MLMSCCIRKSKDVDFISIEDHNRRPYSAGHNIPYGDSPSPNPNLAANHHHYGSCPHMNPPRLPDWDWVRGGGGDQQKDRSTHLHPPPNLYDPNHLHSASSSASYSKSNQHRSAANDGGQHSQHHQHHRSHPCISQLALAMYNTEMTAAAIVGVPNQSFLSGSGTERLVRKAKHEGSTVTMRDGHLYIDYKYIGRVPPGTAVTN